MAARWFVWEVLFSGTGAKANIFGQSCFINDSRLKKIDLVQLKLGFLKIPFYICHN
jgi:hypothetical protein